MVHNLVYKRVRSLLWELPPPELFLFWAGLRVGCVPWFWLRVGRVVLLQAGFFSDNKAFGNG